MDRYLDGLIRLSFVLETKREMERGYHDCTKGEEGIERLDDSTMTTKAS